MIRYTLLIEEDRQVVKTPASQYRQTPEYEVENVTLVKLEGETSSRGTALESIIAAAKDLQPVKVAPGQAYSTLSSVYSPKIVQNGGAA